MTDEPIQGGSTRAQFVFGKYLILICYKLNNELCFSVCVWSIYTFTVVDS